MITFDFTIWIELVSAGRMGITKSNSFSFVELRQSVVEGIMFDG